MYVCLIPLVLLAAGLSPTAGASTPVTPPAYVITASMDAVPLGRYLEYLPDNQGLGPDQLRTRSDFHRVPSPVWIPGPATVPLWIRLRLQNPGTKDRRIWLEQRWIMYRSLRLYTVRGTEPVRPAGEQPDSIARRWSDAPPTWSLTLPPGETTLLIRLDSAIPGMEFMLYDDQSRAKHLGFTSLMIGLLFGGMGIMLIYNFFLFLTMRRPAYFFYVGTLGTMVTEQLIYKRYLIIPGMPVLKAHMLIAQLACIFATLFTSSYVDVRSFNPRLARWNQAAAILMSVSFFASLFTNEQFSLMAALMAGLLCIGMCTIDLLSALRRRNRAPRFLMVAGIPAMLFGLYEITFQTGLIPPNNHHEWNLLVGYLMMTMLISLGLGDRFNQQVQKNAERALQLQSRRMALEATNEATRAIQRALLSHDEFMGSISMAACYRPAEKTGGDWYSVFQDRVHKRLYILIGDVTGHGIPAALITGAVAGAAQTAVERFSCRRRDLQETLQVLAGAINRVVYRPDRETRHLMTMCFLALEESNGELAYLNAGHPPIYLLHDGHIRPLLVRGSVLGREPELRNPGEALHHLVPGDQIFAFTDGLLENHGPDGEMLRVSQLRRLLRDPAPPRILIERIRQHADRTWKGHPLQDDCTFLAIALHGSDKAGHDYETA